MQESIYRVDRQKSVILFGIALLVLSLLQIGNMANPTLANPTPIGGLKSFARIYKVKPEGAMLTLAIPAGSIKVKTWDRAEIKVGGSLLEDSLTLTEKQLDNNIQIEVHCSKAGQSHFEVFVPFNCTLDLKCLNGTIEVLSAQGRILAQTAEGSISLQELKSTNITAKSISGQINYRGVLDPKGIYNFHSVENTVDITLPANSPFTLMATAIAGKIELGGFQLSETVPQEKRVAGKHAGGGASLNLSTHRGQIRLHKIP